MTNSRKIGENYYKKALVYKESGDYISALNEIKLAISYNPFDNTFKLEREVIEKLLDPAVLSDKILEYVRLGNYIAAVNCAEALNCQYPDKYLSLSEQAHGARRMEIGKVAFPSTLVPSAEGFVKEKNFGLAIKLLTEAIALDPEDQSLQERLEEFVNYHKAKLLAAESRKYYPDQINEAIALLEKAVNLSPDDIEYRDSLSLMISERPKRYYDEAKCNYEQKRLEDARRAIATALEYSPGDTDFLKLQEKIAKAIETKEKDEEKKEFRRSLSRSE